MLAARPPYPVGKIFDQVINEQVPHFDLAVQPFGEGLLLDIDPEVGGVFGGGYWHF